jgi:hypothetical protein
MSEETTDAIGQAQQPGGPARGSINGAGSRTDVATQVSGLAESNLEARSQSERSGDDAGQRCTVAAIEVGTIDGRKSEITHVFYKFQEYAIFKSGDEIRIQYADCEETKRGQIEKIAELMPLRDRLQYLASNARLRKRYLPQIANAFFLGLQDRNDCAKQVIEDAIKDIQEVRVREGRITYVQCAIVVALGLAAVLFSLGANAFHKAQVVPLWAAAGSGSIGALLSIAIAVRGRSVATDGDWQTNLVDVAIRVLIGVISAAALYLLLSSGMIANMSSLTGMPVGEFKVSSGTGTPITWQVALVIGFMAGFVERLVPDLLDKKAPAAAK